MEKLYEFSRRYWWLAGVCLPGVLLLILSLHFTAHVPFWDQWEFVDILKHQSAHQLSFNDFWHQHNEHRIFFPRLIMFGLAQLTGWDPFWEVVVNVVLGFGIAAVVLKMVWRQFDGWSRVIVGSIVAWSLLSLMQWENWLWGWQIQWFLSLLASVAAIYWLTKKDLTRRDLCLAIVSSVVATFSLANGFVIWLIGAGLLIFRSKLDRRLLAAWVAAAALAVGLYYRGYVNPSYHPSKTLFLHQPLNFVKYVLSYLGSPVSLYQREAMLIGASLCLVFVGLAAYLWFDKKLRPALLPWIGLAVYGLAGAALTAVSRLGFGVEQARSSRYTSVSVLLIVSIVALAIIAAPKLHKQQPNVEKVLLMFLTAVVLGLSTTYLHGIRAARGQHAHLVRVEQCLTTATQPTDPCLKLTYPNGPAAYERLTFLRSQGLGGHVQLHR